MSVLQTKRAVWSKPRNAATEDDAALSSFLWTDVPTGAYVPSGEQNEIEIAWTMDADGSSCTATLYAARYGGDIVTVWTGTLTGGSQVSTDGGVWVDTIATDTDYWGSDLSGGGVAKIDYEAGNRISRISLDTRGYYCFFFVFGGLSSETVTAYFSGV